MDGITKNTGRDLMGLALGLVVLSVTVYVAARAWKAGSEGKPIVGQ